MSRLSDFSRMDFGRDVVVKGHLDELTRRLAPGMEVDARIVDCLGSGTYVLRVRGYNMISESAFPFRRFDEVILEVKALDPKLVFEMRPADQGTPGGLYA